jgi:4-hydroxy-tetrahydrodipicolinate synthase
MFKGSIVAIVTPFMKGKVDEEGFRRLIEFQIENGTSAIVPVGTTGESPTLDMEEHKRTLEIAVEAVRKRVPVIAGTGGNSTTEAIELTEHARKIGADATLQVTPYYNKPTQEGLYQHFKAIAKAVPLPQVLYNIPGRTGVNMLPQTVARLAEMPEIVAIKEASGSLGQMAEVVQLAGDKITLLSGDDNLTLPILAIGGKGVISVVANIVPKDNTDMVTTALLQTSSFVSGDVYRDQPDPGQNGPGSDGQDRRGDEIASVSHGLFQCGEVEVGLERLRADQIEQAYGGTDKQTLRVRSWILHAD